MRAGRAALLLLAVAVLAALAGGAYRWRRSVLEARAEAYWLRVLGGNGLQAARVVDDWLGERAQDAAVAASAVERALAADGALSPAAADHVAADLRSFVRHEGFEAGWALPPAGVAIQATPAGDSLHRLEREAAARVLSAGAPALSGPWRGPDGAVLLSFLHPVTDGAGRVRGTVVLRADLRRTVLSTVVWDLQPSRTGQTRLVAPQGDSLFVVSPSRHPAAPPMGLGAPRAAAPALWRAAAGGAPASGRFGAGDDAVLATVHPLERPGWGVVRSISTAEAMAFTRGTLGVEAALATAAALALGLAGLAGRRLWRVSAERRAAAVLRESEARHRLLFTRNPLPMWLYDVETLRLVEVNDATVRTYGYSREELLSMTLMDLRDPAEVPALMRSLGSVGSGPREMGVFRHRRKDGRDLLVEIISDDAPILPGARLVLAHDVTERNQAARARQEAHALLATVISSSPLAIATLDREMRVEAWNPAAERMFGWTEEEIRGKPWPLAPPPDSPDPGEPASIHALLVREGHAVQRQVKRLRRDGAVLDLYVSAAPLRDPSGEVRGVVTFLADVGERVQLEEQFRQAQKMEAVGRLAGGVAHDFNNLLTAIRGYGDFLGDALPPGSPLRADLDEMLAATDRAASLTRQLLVFSRKQVTAARDVDLNAVIRDLHRMLVRVLGADIDFELGLAPGDATVHADPVQLDQVLMNLAVNARDAMPRGGRLHMATDLLSPDAAAAVTSGLDGEMGDAPHGFVRLRVTDTGTGMPPAVLERLFEPFFTTKEMGKGTGLGLATVYGIVRQCGGWVGAESTVGAGSTFTVLLPRVLRPADAPAEAPGGAGPAPPAHATVLVVEDEPGVRELVRRSLVRFGYRVLTAESGPAALALARATPERIDLLLTDVVMPGMRGTQLAAEMARLRPGIRILFMSGYPDRGAPMMEELPEDAPLLQKPFSPVQIAARVRAALAR